MRHLLLLVACLCSSFSLAFSQNASTYAEEIAQHRQGYIAKLLSSEYAPFWPEDSTHIQYFPADSTFRVVAKFERTEGAKPFQLPTYSKITKPFVQYGTLTFELHDSTYQLAVYRNLQATRMPMYRDLLFLPIKDQTSGQSTYGGGRYLDLSTNEIHRGQLLLDFNKLYNPYCAYGSGWNCPVPPAGNHLPVAILAGEKAYAGPQRERRE
ncbi:MAG: DUF1684 domain-containing protein [Bacteroidota bacterium]